MDKKKSAIYFLVSVVLFFSLALILASKENKKENPEIIGDYQFWETESASEEISERISETSIPITAEANAEKKSRSRKTTAITLTEPAAETTVEEFVYIDLNHADAEELVKLKGIGYVMAERIIEYRNNFGPFIQTSDIMNVSGIGEKTYNDIREHIYVTISAEDYARIQERLNQNIVPENETTRRYQENSQPDKPVITEKFVLETTEPIIPVLDINTATISDFEKLPGIDKETAENIIALRTAIKQFSHVYELLYAENMTESKLAAILDYIYVKKTE